MATEPFAWDGGPTTTRVASASTQSRRRISTATDTSTCSPLVTRRTCCASGDGRFHTYEVDEEGAGVLDLDTFSGSPVVADFNGDGRIDLALLAFCDYDCNFGTVVLWLNWTGLPAKPCVVPDVTQYLPIAGTLRDYGCRLGRITHRYSRTVSRGWAISQKPKPGIVLPSLAKVDVVVSRGRRHQPRR